MDRKKNCVCLSRRTSSKSSGLCREPALSVLRVGVTPVLGYSLSKLYLYGYVVVSGILMECLIS